MNTQTLDMARKRRTFKIDERILEALKSVAHKSNTSANNWLETSLMNLLKQEGELPKDFLPILENRGGLRVKTETEEGAQND